MGCPRCSYSYPDVIYDANGNGVWCPRCRYEYTKPAGSAVPPLLVLMCAVAAVCTGAWWVFFG